MPASDRPAGMTPDDPRLRAWVEGRLSPAEAAEVERIVRKSKELARTVADLRAIKAASPQGPMRPAAGGDSDASDDAEVADEWRRIEQERLAGERAEALEDVAEEQAAGVAQAGDRGRGRWPMVAMAAALAAGVLFAFVVNSPARRDPERPTAPGDDESAAGLLEEGHGPSAAAAGGPFSGATEGMVVRVSLRDDLGRGKLEEALAASHLRIAGGQPPGADADPTSADGAVEWLSVEGPPAAIDALLAALSEPSESLAVQPAPAAGDVGQKATAATSTPAAVRIFFEIVDQTAGGRATRAGEEGQP